MMDTLNNVIRIGTRSSMLATWQAKFVQAELGKHGVKSDLVFVESEGDLNRQDAITQIGRSGVFTKALDLALMENRIDIAVHSYKDLPTSINDRLSIIAVLERANVYDVLICRENFDFLNDPGYVATIATGSPRRKAQWLNRFPNHTINGIRGNVDSRLKKLRDSSWDGMILARAGIERLGLKPAMITLDWMIPAPAQGAMAIMVRKTKLNYWSAVRKLNHSETETETKIERDFLQAIEAGCSAPVGVNAILRNNVVQLRSVVLSLNGKRKIEVNMTEKLERSNELGFRAAEKAIKGGAKKLMN